MGGACQQGWQQGVSLRRHAATPPPQKLLLCHAGVQDGPELPLAHPGMWNSGGGQVGGSGEAWMGHGRRRGHRWWRWWRRRQAVFFKSTFWGMLRLLGVFWGAESDSPGQNTPRDTWSPQNGVGPARAHYPNGPATTNKSASRVHYYSHCDIHVGCLMGGQNVYGTVLWWIAVTAIHDSNAMPRCGTAVTSGIERMQGIAPSPAKNSNNDYISIPIRSQEGGEEAAPQQNPGSSLAPAPSGARAGGRGKGRGRCCRWPPPSHQLTPPAGADRCW